MNDAAIEVIRHEGPLSLETAESLYDAIWTGVRTQGWPRALVGISIELIQNLRMHGGADGCFSLSRDDSAWRASAGNRTTTAQAVAVADYARGVNELSGEALAEKIREVRQQAGDPTRPGAGLGLMTLRRLSRKPLDVSIEPVSEQEYMLVIAVHLTHKAIP